MTSPPRRNYADDADLMRRVRDRQPGALEELIRLYEPQVRRLAHRLMGWRGDTDDAVQDVFLAAFEKAHHYRGHASLWTWLTAITLNKCRSALRRRAVRDRLSALLALRPRPTADSLASPESDELAAQVRSAVSALAPRDREVIVLRYLEERQTADIAQMLGVSINAIEVRLHRARQRLREQLNDFMKD